MLLQLWSAQGKRNFKDDSQLHITFEQLKRRKGSIQCFAIYVPETVAYEKRFEVALQMVDIFIMKFYPTRCEVYSDKR